MKRELKGSYRGAVDDLHEGFKTDPDEKGTERDSPHIHIGRGGYVSRLIPMKRELKG